MLAPCSAGRPFLDVVPYLAVADIELFFQARRAVVQSLAASAPSAVDGAADGAAGGGGDDEAAADAVRSAAVAGAVAAAAVPRAAGAFPGQACIAGTSNVVRVTLSASDLFPFLVVG